MIPWVHFSATVRTALAHAAHPLQSFSENMLEGFQDVTRRSSCRAAACTKQSMSSEASEHHNANFPFIIDEGGPDFNLLLPGVPNPHYRIPAQTRFYYHGLCVLANNFSCVLWQKFFSEMRSRFSVSHEHLKPFLKQTFDHLERDPGRALTGPLVRGDVKTLENDLSAFEGDAFQRVFQSFVDAFAVHQNSLKGDGSIKFKKQ